MAGWYRYVTQLFDVSSGVQIETLPLHTNEFLSNEYELIYIPVAYQPNYL